MINGANVSDPNRDFSAEEWNRLGADGRAQILQRRQESRNRRSGGRGGNNRGRGQAGRDFEAWIAALEAANAPNEDDPNARAIVPVNNDVAPARGAGAGFGRGLHAGQWNT